VGDIYVRIYNEQPTYPLEVRAVLNVAADCVSRHFGVKECLYYLNENFDAFDFSEIFIITKKAYIATAPK
jgi:hypothetical protein